MAIHRVNTLLKLLFMILCCHSMSSAQVTDSLLSKARQQGQGRLLPVENKYQLWVEEAGTGDTDLLILPGGPGDSHKGYVPFLHNLAERGVRVHILNMVDCGLSDRTQDSNYWNLANYIRDIDSVCKQLGLKKFYLLGHSFGGLIALEYAKQHPTALQGVIVSNMTDSWSGLIQNAGDCLDSLLSHNSEGQQITQQMQSIDSTSAIFRQLANRYDSLSGQLFNQFTNLAKSDVTPALQPLYSSPDTLIGKNLDVYRYFWQSQEINDWDFRPFLSQLQLPVLVMGSGRDHALTATDMTRMKASLPNATLAFYPQAGHVPFWTEDDRYFQPLLTFLKTKR
ncbi:alpha/beta fold hydrolase [Spirosoma sp. KUDC1026]|uniref:alpha/beta fold hydrolase n=1 Tax=Spirosoma sp. KUDC1026 TaxID=2745947 RepID=UPI00159BA105|nr:alpha/beta fold hydrolase [Spirosoma sp. KUDC1026]QKZ15058.1 alpha/beta fold hydrolase [Spirosoma sp. KUDC1026]